MSFFHCEAARNQKFKQKDGETVNPLKRAIAVAESNLEQGFTECLGRYFPIRMEAPADAHAAENVSVEMICIRIMLILVS